MFSFCMYCCKERCASIAISIFSVLFALTAATTIYLTQRLKTESYVWDLQQDPLIQDSGQSDQPSVDTIKLIIYWGVIGICALAILVAILGIGTAVSKSCCTISLYSFFTLILTVVFLGVGGFLMTVNVASNLHIQSYCANKGDVPKGKAAFTMNFARYFLTYVDDYQQATNQMIKQYMCTPLCPCVQISNMSVAYPKGFNRMDSLNNFEGSYTNFSKCYQDMHRDNRIKEVLSPTLLSLINYLETNQQCTGLCEIPPFPFYKDVRSGPSQQTCENIIAKLYNMTLGILSIGLLATGLIIFLAFNAQYGLWRRRFSKPPLKSKDRQMNYMVEDTSKL